MTYSAYRTLGPLYNPMFLTLEPVFAYNFVNCFTRNTFNWKADATHMLATNSTESSPS